VCICRYDRDLTPPPIVIGLIPIIRHDSPKTKIIYRSHIESEFIPLLLHLTLLINLVIVRSDLIDAGRNIQADVFAYLFGFIKQADLFISVSLSSGYVHNRTLIALPASCQGIRPQGGERVYARGLSVYDTIRYRLPCSMLYLDMPPSTDPLDGLNKPIPIENLEVYRHYFNTLMGHSTGQQLDWNRGYILQVARFDPSKGIPDLVEGYRLFREAFDKLGTDECSPQLILV
jgi:alpha,alpha-trehalose phosphorylase (configuration-retaining)